MFGFRNSWNHACRKSNTLMVWFIVLRRKSISCDNIIIKRSYIINNKLKNIESASINLAWDDIIVEQKEKNNIMKSRRRFDIGYSNKGIFKVCNKSSLLDNAMCIFKKNKNKGTLGASIGFRRTLEFKQGCFFVVPVYFTSFRYNKLDRKLYKKNLIVSRISESHIK